MVRMRDDIPINVLTFKFYEILYQYYFLDESRKKEGFSD